MRPILAIALFTVSVAFNNLLMAQHALDDQISGIKCGSYLLMQEINRLDTNFLHRDAQRIKNAQATAKTNNEDIYSIPVVFHVLYNNPAENIPDSVIYDQLRVLNECYRRENADTTNTREEFKPYSADAKIQFRMATTDPNGDPTDGIHRVSTNVEYFGGFISGTPNVSQIFDNYDRMANAFQGGTNAWDPEKYLNVWIGDMRYADLQSGDNNFVSLAIASPPLGHPNFPPGSIEGLGFNGVLIHYAAFGSNNPDAFDEPYEFYNESLSFGKSLVHEIGHYLGLRHIWGDGDCRADDFVDDTPLASGPGNNSTTNCPFSTNSCFDNIDGQNLPDNTENFMDYRSGICLNMYTHGQKAVMRNTLETYRANLYSIEYPTSIPERENTFKVSIYPNPSAGDVSIELENLNGVYSVNVLNSLGKVIRTMPNQNGKTNIAKLAPGFYWAEVQYEQKKVTKKIIVQ